MALVSIPLLSNAVEYLLMCFWPLSSLPTVSGELFALFLSCKSSLFIMESSLGQMYALQIFSPVCGLPFFVFLTLSFDEVFILMKKNFFLSFTVHAFGVLSKLLCLSQGQNHTLCVLLGVLLFMLLCLGLWPVSH